MLELRPNFECCDKDLPPDSIEARICTYEFTFCADCVDGVLKGVCPNCRATIDAMEINSLSFSLGVRFIAYP
ncbi:DUF1272 domain-containing protein, partial [Rhizobium ruizarguesonis]